MAVLLFLDKVDEQKARVMTIHYMPELLSEEEKQNGVLVDSFVEPETPKGKLALPYWNYETKSVFFEFVDMPLTENEQLQKQIEMQEQAIAELSMLFSMTIV